MLEQIQNKKDLKNFTLSELQEIVVGFGEPKYRAIQIFKDIYEKRVSSFDDFKTISKQLKAKLENDYVLQSIKSFKKQISIDGSVKYLFNLNDDKNIEAVFMPWMTEESDIPIRTTLCISSQVGCAVDCKFCATGKLGFTRNLQTSEIIEQITLIEKDLDIKLTNIVFMGMGEPLLNYKNVISAIEIMTDENVKMINRKRITVSTSGVVPKILQLAEEKNPVKLAISLHATTNGVRDKIVPLNKKMNIQKIMDAVEVYYRKTKMPVTYEYIPFDNLNDTDADAKRLAKIAQRVPSRINIIPFNDISFTNPTGYAAELKPTPRAKIDIFAEKIRFYGGVVIVRDTFGDDIDAACGQLALSVKEGVAV